MAIVADASPLIVFARAGRLDILRDLFGEVIVPPRVAAEAFRTAPARPGAAALAAATESWLCVEASTDLGTIEALTPKVDPGEAEAIALAAQRSLLLLIDDRAGRRAAQAIGVPVTGSGGLLVAAKRNGLVSYIRPVLDALVSQGLCLSPQLYRQFLQQAGELSAGDPL